MPHTQGRYQCDLPPVTDGIFLFGPEDVIGLAAANCVMTRNAAGDYSLNTPASQTVTIALQSGKIMQRLGQALDLQEQYGGSTFRDPLGAAAGRPPRTGNPLVVRSGYIDKGIKITGFKVCELISAVNLIAHTCRVDKVVYANGVANAVTAVLASGANGLPTAFAATPYVTTVTLAAAEQIFRVTDLSKLIFELGVQTNAGGTYRFQSIEVLVEWNAN